MATIYFLVFPVGLPGFCTIPSRTILLCAQYLTQVLCMGDKNKDLLWNE